MDSGSFSSSSSPFTTTTGSFSSSSSLSIRNIQSRRNLSRYKPFQDHHTVQENHHLPRQYGDRFIPNRSAMDFNMAHYLLVHSKKNKENEKNSVVSTSKAAYRKHLAEALGMNRTQILQFKSKPLAPVDGIFQEALSDSIPTHQLKSKPRRFIPKTEESWIEVPGIIDDYHLNLLDWSSSNIVAIAVANTVYLSNASDDSFTELLTVDEKTGPITSISWHPDGKHIAVGMASSIVELWDATADRKLGTLRGGHDALVGSLSWNNHILTTGGMDSFIFDNDLRIRCPIVQTYIGHQKEVCGLKWSSTGQQLASGGADNLLYIWDRSMASSNAPSSQWLHRFEDHSAIVKAIAWCPFQSNLLASGGGAGDHCIKFWNTRTGACLNSVDTGSEVTSLLWSKNERELLSSQGFTQSQLTLWKYPSMVTMAELTGHTSTVLFTAQSPDGCTVASAAGDGSLRFWNVFGSPEVAKPAPKATNLGPFTNLMRIR